MDAKTLENIDRQAEGLVGGMALPNGVMFMSTHGVGVGYYDQAGQLKSLSRPLDPQKMRRIGPIGRMLWMFVEWAMVLPSTVGTLPAEEDRKPILIGMILGAPVGLGLRLVKLAFWKIYLGILVLAALAVLVIPALRRYLQEMRRYHGAEHQLLHVVGMGGIPSNENLSRQPVFHPLCGTTALVPMLPLILVLPFLPWWGQFLGWPLFFLGLLLSVMAIVNEGRQAWARGWLRLGRWGQGLTAAPTETRHREAALAAWEALRGCDPAVEAQYGQP